MRGYNYFYGELVGPCVRVCILSCAQAKKASKAEAKGKAKSKVSAKQQAKIDNKRFKFDPSNIPAAVDTAMMTEYSDLSSTQKRLVTIDGKNLPQALTAGYEFNASMGRNYVEEGFFVQFRRIYSVSQSHNLPSSSSVASAPEGQLVQLQRSVPRVLTAGDGCALTYVFFG